MTQGNVTEVVNRVELLKETNHKAHTTGTNIIPGSKLNAPYKHN